MRYLNLSKRLPLIIADSAFNLAFRLLGGSPQEVAVFAQRTRYDLFANYAFLYLYVAGFGASAIEIFKKRDVKFVKPKFQFYAAEILAKYGQDEYAEQLMDECFGKFLKFRDRKLATNSLKWYSKRSNLSQEERQARIDQLCDFLTNDSSQAGNTLVQVASARMRFANSTHSNYQWIPLLPWPTNNQTELVAMAKLTMEISREGRADLAREILSRVNSINRSVYEIEMLRNFPADIDINNVNIPESIYGRLRLLDVFRFSKNLSKDHEARFQSIVDSLCEDFKYAISPEREAILRLFTSANLHDQSIALLNSTQRGWADNYTAIVLRGWQAFENSEFSKSRDLFIEAVRQNPSYSSARNGLKFSMMRCGATFQEVAAKVEEITLSLRHWGGETTWMKLEQGDLKGYGEAVQRSPSWQALKNFSGGRYLDCFPKHKLPGKSILFVSYWGIGDEIRQAWMYKFLVKNFDVVHVTCEPRLLTILQNSFPTIHFYPMIRPRRGVAEVASAAERFAGWGGLLREALIEDLRPLLTSVDYICGAYTFYASSDHIRMDDYVSDGFLKPILSQKHERNANRPFRVGILWRSHLLTGARKLMYFGQKSLTDLLVVEGVEFHSIQHKITEDEAMWCRQKGIIINPGLDLFSDFTGMADYYSSFDLVIGISTASTELAAAIGVPVWLVGFSPENYFLRTAGGRTEKDILSANTITVGPKVINFSCATEISIAETMQNVREKLEAEVVKQKAS